ncbi:MAG: hypothetical protein ACI8ZN_001518, partial [Bacteroidia bacterium]
ETSFCPRRRIQNELNGGSNPGYPTFEREKALVKIL